MLLVQMMTISLTKSFSPEEAYKELVDLVESPGEPKGIPFPERIPSPKCLNERIAIVGAGPSGIHMAYLLKKKGFQNVVVLEKSNRVGGKSYTVKHRDTLHELGTCCTQPDYEDNVLALAQEFGLWEPANLPSFNVWLEGLSNSISYASYVLPEAMKLAETNDPQVAVESIFAALTKYVRLHRELFGKYNGELMRKPTPRVMSMVNCTFLEFIKEHKLTMLMPILIMSHTGGYGYMDEVSALYGLMWNTPNLLKGMAGGMSGAQLPFYLIKGGFQMLWETIQTWENIDVRFGVDITRIYRRNDKVLIKYSSSKDWAEFDFLIWTPSLFSNLHLIDASDKEKELFSGLNPAWFSTTLFDSTYGNRGEAPVDIWLSTVENKKEQAVWEQRDSYGTLNNYYGPTYQDGSLPGGPDGRYIRTGVAYQYGKVKPDESTLEEIFQQHFAGLNATEIEVIERKIWEYFPRFSPEKMASGVLWDIFDNQGSRRTWFAGSSVIIESVKSVLEYNKLLVSKMATGVSCR